MHRRFLPKAHHLRHEIFMFYLDLDELDATAKRVFGFSRNRRNLYSFRDADHEPAGEGPLKARVVRCLRDRGIELGPSGRVMLLTLPRVLGYVFNPISIYFCFDSEARPMCAIAEVGNTFREVKLYLLGEDEFAGGAFTKLVPKHFYVSPFSSLNLNFDFQLKIPDEQLEIKVDDYDGDDRTLMSVLAGRRAPLNSRTLARFSLEYPLITLKVIFLIHWHALRLWLKGVPFHRKAANSNQQRDVLRPHSSLAPRLK